MVVAGGTLTLTGGGAVSALGGVRVEAGGTLVPTDGGTLAADVTNAGTVSLGSRSSPSGGDAFVIDGDYTQLDMAFLVMGIGGSGHDSLSVTGTASLAGTFELELPNGYQPSAAASYSMLNYGARSGTFDAVELPPTLGGDWEERYDNSALDDAFSLWMV